MLLTKKRALRLHRRMWSDMQKDLGDNPMARERVAYKEKWCEEHFPNEDIPSDCFLCKYDDEHGIGKGHKPCEHCPIDWGETVYIGCSHNEVTYQNSPISAILALPERKGV